MAHSSHFRYDGENDNNEENDEIAIFRQIFRNSGNGGTNSEMLWMELERD